MIAKEWGEDILLYAKRGSNLDYLAFGEQRTLFNIFVEQLLWLEVQFGRSDTLLALLDKTEKTFKDIQPIFCIKVKFMDMKPIKGETP